MTPPTRMTSRRSALVLAVIAALCLLGGVFGSNASADRNGKVQLAVGGAGFTSTPAGSLLNTSALTPGATVGATFGVRSRFDVSTALTLRFVDVHDDDNGCTPAEARVDMTCGIGQGELGRNLIVTVSAASTRTGIYRQVWQGRASDLLQPTTPGVHLGASADEWLHLVASVPSSVGNVVESDTYRFGLRVELQGSGVDGQSGVAGAGTGHSGQSSSSSGVGGLATTGFSTVLFCVGGGMLVLAGLALLAAARRQRRT